MIRGPPATAAVPLKMPVSELREKRVKQRVIFQEIQYCVSSDDVQATAPLDSALVSQAAHSAEDKTGVHLFNYMYMYITLLSFYIYTHKHAHTHTHTPGYPTQNEAQTTKKKEQSRAMESFTMQTRSIRNMRSAGRKT